MLEELDGVQPLVDYLQDAMALMLPADISNRRSAALTLQLIQTSGRTDMRSDKQHRGMHDNQALCLRSCN